MTKALVALHDTTYGGVYYSNNIDFTDLTTQPTWAKLATTGLDNLLVKVMRNDYFSPYDKIYLQLDNDDIYRWNGSSWTKVLDLATARTQSGYADGVFGYIAIDKANPGYIYVPIQKLVTGCKLMKSTDYGANWSVVDVVTDLVTGTAYAAVHDQYISICTGDIYRCAFMSSNGGASWGAQNLWNNSAGGAPIKIDVYDPQYFYYRQDSSDADLTKVKLGTVAVVQDGYSLANNMAYHEHMQWIDPNVSGHQRILRSLSNNVTIFSTVDNWANFVDSTPTNIKTGFTATVGALHCALENSDYGAFGVCSAGAGTPFIQAFVGDNPTACYGIAGTNWNTGPYTDAIPYSGAGYVAFQGIFVGEAPADKGVYVYADELGDITDIPDYDGLGIPLFGDRSSWRDLPADGFDIYHAEDVEAAMPQIHAPWDADSPPGAGYGIVSDGSKWVVSSDEIALQSDLHAAVTLAADADTLLGLTGQQLTLDTQNANTVLAGPTTGAAADPAFRALVAKDLGTGTPDGTKFLRDDLSWQSAGGALALNDLTDVDTTGTSTGDIIYNSGSGWVDYPLGIGSKVSVTSNKLRFGNESGGNYLEIDLSTGNLRLVGQATAFDDLRIEPNVRQAAGAGVPSFEKYFDDSAGTSKGVYLYSFTDESVAGNEKEIFFAMQMPHNWKVGSDISMHVHFVPASTVNSSDIIWGLEYTWKSIGQVYGDTTIVYSSTTLLPDDANITASKHYISEFTDLTPGTTASGLSSILIGRLFRNSSAAGDTYTDKVGLLYIDAHYEIDSFGSDQEYVKDTTSALLMETGDYLLLETGDNILLE